VSQISVFNPPTVVNAALTKTVVLTSAQVKTLNATPITIIAAPGAGKFISILNASANLTYGGSNVFIAGAAQSIALRYTNGSGDNPGSASLLLNAGIVSTSSYVNVGFPILARVGALALFENQPIVAWNPIATEISGNAANNNTITIAITYLVFNL